VQNRRGDRSSSCSVHPRKQVKPGSQWGNPRGNRGRPRGASSQKLAASGLGSALAVARPTRQARANRQQRSTESSGPAPRGPISRSRPVTRPIRPFAPRWALPRGGAQRRRWHRAVCAGSPGGAGILPAQSVLRPSGLQAVGQGSGLPKPRPAQTQACPPKVKAALRLSSGATSARALKNLYAQSV
jgi:hypothetical protein